LYFRPSKPQQAIWFIFATQTNKQTTNSTHVVISTSHSRFNNGWQNAPQVRLCAELQEVACGRGRVKQALSRANRKHILSLCVVRHMSHLVPEGSEHAPIDLVFLEVVFFFGKQRYYACIKRQNG
jgi:hypothetical protein